MSLVVIAMLQLAPAEAAFYGDAYYQEPTYSVSMVARAWALPDRWGSDTATGCTGRFTIRPDGTALIESGAAVVEQRLDFELDEDALDWMHRTVTKSNGKADCNGKVWAEGAHDAWSFDVTPRNELRLCVVDKAKPLVFAQPCPHVLSPARDG